MKSYTQITDVSLLSGTSLQAYTVGEYPSSSIIKVFGEGIGPGDKTTHEWIFVCDQDGEAFSVYDYKAGYLSDLPYRWHIGGNQRSDCKSFLQWFEKSLVENQ